MSCCCLNDTTTAHSLHCSCSSSGSRPRLADGLVLLPVQHLVFRAAVPLLLAVTAVFELLHRGLALVTGGQAARVQAVHGDVGSPSCSGLFQIFNHPGFCIRKPTNAEHGLERGSGPSSTKSVEELRTRIMGKEMLNHCNKRLFFRKSIVWENVLNRQHRIEGGQNERFQATLLVSTQGHWGNHPNHSVVCRHHTEHIANSWGVLVEISGR